MANKRDKREQRDDSGVHGRPQAGARPKRAEIDEGSTGAGIKSVGDSAVTMGGDVGNTGPNGGLRRPHGTRPSGGTHAARERDDLSANDVEGVIAEHGGASPGIDAYTGVERGQSLRGNHVSFAEGVYGDDEDKGVSADE